MDGPTPAGAADPPGCSCKVGRVARDRGLVGLDADLRERHAAGASLRDLEEYVNVTLLERALADAAADVVGDVEGVYRGLTGSDASAGERTELRERLRRAGVDVEALGSAFVSYQTVRSHLRECLGVDTDRTEALDPDDALGTIAWARARSEGVVERTLERLARDDALATGDLDVSQVLRVSCGSCGVTAPVDAFVERGGCDCASAASGGPAGSDDATGTSDDADPTA